MTRTIVFSHANGFPAGTYRVLFDIWRAAGWHVLAVEKFGHDPRYAVSSNWPHLCRELVDFVQREAPGERVQFVGHSLGGYLSLLAACRQPALAAGVVLVDSPLVAGWRALVLRGAKATGFVGRLSPARVSQTRRDHWDSSDAVHAHYAAKSVFQRWDQRVLRDYIAAGIEPAGAGVRLAFRRDIETQLYNTFPHTLGSLLRKQPPQCPVSFIGGTQSAEVRQVGMAKTEAVTQGRIEWLDGTHLFPMEQPEAAAEAVLRALAAG